MYDRLIPHLQCDGYPDVLSLEIFKRLASIELQVDLRVGQDPPDRHISTAKKILKASEYSGRKVVKVRALRLGPIAGAPWGCAFLGVENLDVVVA